MIIGITGGIASGKSVVSDHLRALGYPVVDADELAREVVAPGSPTLAAVAATFGDDIIAADGSLDRPALGRRIYGDAAARAQLDAITHPAIGQLAQARFAAQAEAPLIFFVVPLLYESGMDALCDSVWLVHAEESLRRARLMARDHIDAAYASQKIAAQMAEAERLARADHILYNDGDPARLYAQVEALIKSLKKSEKRC